jgi:uncharacterized RDD family membrane protein YckC
MTEFYVPSTYRRLVARFIDKMIEGLFYLPFFRLAYDLFFTDDDVYVSLWQLLVLLLIPAVYEFIFLIFFQATPGKLIMGLKVVPDHNPQEKLSLENCILRPLTERLSIFFSLAIYATAFFRYDRTHVADWVARTRVVQSKPRATRTRVRWVLGLLLIAMYGVEGLKSASYALRNVDWEGHRIELRDYLNLPEIDFDFDGDEG